MANKSGGGPSHESLKGPLLASGLVSSGNGNAGGAAAGGHLLQHSFAASHYPGGRTAWEEAAPIIPSSGPTSGPLAFKRPSSAAQTAAEIRFRVKKASQATARPASATTHGAARRPLSAGHNGQRDQVSSANQAEMNAMRQQLADAQRELGREQEARLAAEAALKAGEASAAAMHEEMGAHHSREMDLRRQVATANKSAESQRKLLTERQKHLERELAQARKELVEERKKHAETHANLRSELTGERQAHSKALELSKKYKNDRRMESARADEAADAARAELYDELESSQRKLVHVEKELEEIRLELRETHIKNANASRLQVAELEMERNRTREAMNRLTASKAIDPRDHAALKHEVEKAREDVNAANKRASDDALAFIERVSELEAQLAAVKVESSAASAEFETMSARLVDHAKQVLLERADAYQMAAAAGKKRSVESADRPTRQTVEQMAERLAEENAKILARAVTAEESAKASVETMKAEVKRMRLQLGTETRRHLENAKKFQNKSKEIANITESYEREAAELRRQIALFEAKAVEANELARTTKTSELRIKQERDYHELRTGELTSQVTKLSKQVESDKQVHSRLSNLEGKLQTDYVREEVYANEKEERLSLQKALKDAKEELSKRTAAMSQLRKEKEETAGILQQSMLKNVQVQGENEKMVIDNRRMNIRIDRLEKDRRELKEALAGGGGGDADGGDNEENARDRERDDAMSTIGQPRLNPATAAQEVQRLTATLEEARSDARRAKRQGELKAERWKRALDEANGKLSLLQDDVAGKMRERLEQLESEYAGLAAELDETRAQLSESSADARSAKDTLTYLRSRQARKLGGLGVSEVSATSYAATDDAEAAVS